MNRIQPVFLTHQDGVTDIFLAAAMSGVIEMLNIAGMSQEIPVINFGVWRNQNYRTNNHLTDFQSIDWFIEMGRKFSTRRDQLNSGKILDLMSVEPIRRTKPHYDICILNQDIYPGEESVNFVIGVGRRGYGTVLSSSRFEYLKDERARYEVFKTCTMHEFGHVLGLVGTFRTNDVEDNLGMHCTNICVMRQGQCIPDFIKITNNRLAGSILCSSCIKDLYNYFK